MKIKQISVFLENKPGRLAAITEVLADFKINVRAMSLADTADFGILRLILDNPEKANQILKDNNFTVSITDVICVEISDKPGGLNAVLEEMGKLNINIEYMYAFLGRLENGAMVIFRVENTDKALESLKKSGCKLLDENTVYKM